MRPLRTWEFHNAATGERQRVEAPDGHEAWKKFWEKSPIGNSWDIQPVCPCGKASAHAYCSEKCFDFYYKR